MKSTDFVNIPGWFSDFMTVKDESGKVIFDGIDNFTEAGVLAKIYSLTSDGTTKTNCTMEYLAGCIFSTRITVVRIIRKLVKLGLVERQVDPNNKNVIHLAVTDKVLKHLDNKEELTQPQMEVEEIVENAINEVVKDKNNISKEKIKEVAEAAARRLHHSKLIKQQKQVCKDSKPKEDDKKTIISDELCNKFMAVWNYKHKQHPDSQTVYFDKLTPKRKELVAEILGKRNITIESGREAWNAVQQGIYNAMESLKAQGKTRDFKEPVNIEYLLMNFDNLILNKF